MILLIYKINLKSKNAKKRQPWDSNPQGTSPEISGLTHYQLCQAVLHYICKSFNFLIKYYSI